MIREHLQPAHQGILAPVEMAVLQRVFDRKCTTFGIQKNSNQAEGLAATLFTLYERGVRTEEQLEAMVERSNSFSLIRDS